MSLKKYILDLKLEKSNTTIEDYLDRIPYHYYDMKNEVEKDKKTYSTYELIGKKFYLNFFGIPKKWNEIYIGIYDTPPKLWHKATSVKDVNDILDIYNIKYDETDDTDNKNYTITRGYVGKTEDSMSISTFERFSYFHPLIVPLPWGKKFKSDFTILNDNNPYTIASYATYILEEDEDEKSNEISFFTKFSRSVFSITQINNLFFMQIKYCYMDENKYPADIEGILCSLPKLHDHNDLLKMDPPKIQIALTVASNVRDFLEEVHNELETMYDEKYSTYPTDVKKVLHDNLAKMTINKKITTELDKISDGTVQLNKKQLINVIKKACKDKKFKASVVDKHIKFIFAELSS